MFKRDEIWDHGFFKRLSKNDTGQENHQAGPLVNIDIQEYFPPILAKPTKLKSAVSIPLTAELWNGKKYIKKVPVRYQIQSWPKNIKKNGDFKQEKRITRNMSELLDEADAGDFLVLQRRLDSTSDYRLTLITKANSLYKRLRVITNDLPVGPIYPEFMPESFVELEKKAEIEEQDTEKGDFHPVEKDPNISETIVSSYCRDKAFRKKVLEIYAYRCAACRKGITAPSGLKEVDAAHIIPRSYAGANDARNGIALCKSHHWAFDKGLFWIDDNRKIYVPSVVRIMKENKDISRLHGRKLLSPKNKKLEPAMIALAWHRDLWQ